MKSKADAMLLLLLAAVIGLWAGAQKVEAQDIVIPPPPPPATATCPSELSNLTVCAPFVVPGAGPTTAGSECCTALQTVGHECLCNTLRIVARLPSQCGLPSISCTA